MKKPFQYLLTFSTILCSMTVFGQTDTESKKCKLDSTIVKGTYNGKNLFFANTPTNGIQSIAIDNQIVSTEFESTFEMDFSKFSLETGQSFKLEIIYCKTNPIPYTILNPEVIK